MLKQNILKKINPYNLKNFFKDYGNLMLCAYCLITALSIALAQIFIIPFILSSLIYLLDKKDPINQETKNIDKLFPPFITLFLISSIGVIIGVNPLKALEELIKSFLYLLLPFSIYYHFKVSKLDEKKTLKRAILYLSLIVFSQFLASFHSILEHFIGNNYLPKIPGALTESGQIVLTFPVLIALIIVPTYKYLKTSKKTSLFLYLSLLFVATTLILNLKRGPWMGVGFEILILGTLLSRRLILTFSIIAITSIILIEPVQTRLLDSFSHFNIEGGRRYMWALGAQLIERYPLGIGLDNASYMRILDPTLPPTHRHMHNNILNILVECGWLGLASYLWWLYEIIKTGMTFFYKNFKSKQKTLGILSLALSTSIIGWQLAGIVEYNFGDGEIKILALFIIGLIFSITEKNK